MERLGQVNQSSPGNLCATCASFSAYEAHLGINSLRFACVWVWCCVVCCTCLRACVSLLAFFFLFVISFFLSFLFFLSFFLSFFLFSVFVSFFCLSVCLSAFVCLSVCLSVCRVFLPMSPSPCDRRRTCATPPSALGREPKRLARAPDPFSHASHSKTGVFSFFSLRCGWRQRGWRKRAR